MAFAPAGDGVLALCPAAPELRADPGAVNERTGVVVAAAVEALVEAAGRRARRASAATCGCGSARSATLALRYPGESPGRATLRS